MYVLTASLYKPPSAKWKKEVSLLSSSRFAGKSRVGDCNKLHPSLRLQMRHEATLIKLSAILIDPEKGVSPIDASAEQRGFKRDLQYKFMNSQIAILRSVNTRCPWSKSRTDSRENRQSCLWSAVKA